MISLILFYIFMGILIAIQELIDSIAFEQKWAAHGGTVFSKRPWIVRFFYYVFDFLEDILMWPWIIWKRFYS